MCPALLRTIATSTRLGRALLPAVGLLVLGGAVLASPAPDQHPGKDKQRTSSPNVRKSLMNPNPTPGNLIKSLRSAPMTLVNGRATSVVPGVEIELYSPRGFPATDARPVLRIGAQEFIISRYPDDGRLDTLIFSLPTQAFSHLQDGTPVMVYYSPGSVTHHWEFGKLNKRRLNR